MGRDVFNRKYSTQIFVLQIDWGAIDFGPDTDKAADTIDFGDLVNSLSYGKIKHTFTVHTSIHFIDKSLVIALGKTRR